MQNGMGFERSAGSNSVGCSSPDVDNEIYSTLRAGASVTLSMDTALATDKRERARGQPKLPKNKRRITNAGDTLKMTVIDDVKTGTTIVIPKGARGTGVVTMVAGRGGFGKAGKIEFELNYIELDGKKIEMEGRHLQKGKSRNGEAIIGAILTIPPAGFLIKGDEADVPLLSEWTFSTKNHLTVDRHGSILEICTQ